MNKKQVGKSAVGYDSIIMLLAFIFELVQPSQSISLFVWEHKLCQACAQFRSAEVSVFCPVCQNDRKQTN